MYNYVDNNSACVNPDFDAKVSNILNNCYNYVDNTVEPTDDAGDLYQQYKEKLSREWGKSAPKQKRIEKLMKKTYTKRREWIVKDVPAVMDIVTEFAMFKDPEYVRKCVPLMYVYVIININITYIHLGT